MSRSNETLGLVSNGILANRTQLFDPGVLAPGSACPLQSRPLFPLARSEKAQDRPVFRPADGSSPNRLAAAGQAVICPFARDLGDDVVCHADRSSPVAARLGRQLVG